MLKHFAKQKEIRQDCLVSTSFIFFLKIFVPEIFSVQLSSDDDIKGLFYYKISQIIEL